MSRSQSIAPSSDLTLRKFFETIYRPRKIPGCKDGTSHKYNILFRHLERHMGREPMVSDLTEDVFASYVAERLPGRSPATVDGEQAKLLALANYAAKKGYLPEVPDVAPIKVYKRIPIACTVDEIGRWLTAAGKVKGDINGIPARLYWTCLFMVLYDTGARQGAARSLRWEDYQPDIPALLLRAETQKQKTDQLLKIANDTAAVLETIRKPERELIFPWPFHGAYFYAHVKRILNAAGLPNGRREQCQKIRRTTLSLMHARGGDATMQAGHSSSDVTRKSYLDTTGAKHAAEIIPRPLAPEGIVEPETLPEPPETPVDSGDRPGWLDYLDPSDYTPSPTDGLCDGLRHIIRNCGIPAQELSQKVGLCRGVAGQFLSGNRRIQLKAVDSICNFLGVQVAFVVPAELPTSDRKLRNDAAKIKALDRAVATPANADMSSTSLARRLNVSVETIYKRRKTQAGDILPSPL